MMDAVIALARSGIYLPEHTSPLASACTRPYNIRAVEERDLSDLVDIERTCWEELALPASSLVRRLSCSTASHWVCEVDSRVVGVMYTRKLRSVDDLLRSETNFANQDDLIADEGAAVVQLLGVAVLPAYARLQLGAALRNFVIQLCWLNHHVNLVIAMTRCSSSTNGSEAEYYGKVASCNDPTLQFHVSGGAEVVQVVQHFRPEDKVNFGHAVLVRYNLGKPAASIDEHHPVGSGEIFPDHGQQLSPSELRELLVSVLDGPRAEAVSTLSVQDFLDTPFMDLGLTSLELMELRSLLSARLNNAAIATTVLFDYPTPGHLLQHIADGGGYPTRHQAAAAPTAITASHPTEEKSSFAICSMSCRFPGGVKTPDEFYAALLNKVDAVSAVPKEWNWDSRTQHAAFLFADSAESFDPAFFKLNAAEARQMDPHQRILLEVSHEALAAAGVLNAHKGSASSKVGIPQLQVCFTSLYLMLVTFFCRWECLSASAIRTGRQLMPLTPLL
jgi:hypothetical protein